MTELAVSILGADFMHLQKAIDLCEMVAHRIHVDVMDGHFVHNLSFGFPILTSLQSKLPIDAHLMISNPEIYAAQYAKYVDTVYIHAETGLDTWERCAGQVRGIGKNCGIVLNPETSVSAIAPVMHLLTHVLIMSVDPGFGGQECKTEVFEKIAELKAKNPTLHISVDGGINDTTAPLARAKGADLLISGSFVLKSADPATAAKVLVGSSGS